MDDFSVIYEALKDQLAAQASEAELQEIEPIHPIELTEIEELRRLAAELDENEPVVFTAAT